jgi:membrane-bound metal-dependent hydrolase YbcI (DUF457 family)
MFIGHYAVALAAKTAAPKTSLGTLFGASVFLDLLWPVFLLAGIERVRVDPAATRFTPLDFEHYPWSHSLLMSVVWGAVLGVFYFLIRKDRRAAIVVGALVVSHWLLDLPMHRPDLPLVPWSTVMFGGGLWNNVALTLAFEFALFAVGIFLYVRATEAENRVGSWGLVLVLLFMTAIYFAAGFGPPPPDAEAIAWTGHAQWLFVALAAYVDAQRTSKAVSSR